MVDKKNQSIEFISSIILRAKTFYKIHAGMLREQLRDDVQRALDAVEASRRLSKELGVDEICRLCETVDGGSCCGRGIENYYGVPLILANFMVRVLFPLRRHDPRGCFFLSSNGCLLTFRHTLCVNFLCKKIYNTLHNKDFILLQHVCGEEIDYIFALHEGIIAFMRRYGGGYSNS